MAAAAGSNSGGAGGVFRRHSARNRPTPYERPATSRQALRNPVEAAAAATGGLGGWFSKLKDPLSRIVQSSYTRFFSLGSRKRLGPPATNSEPLPESRDESPNEVSNMQNPFSGAQVCGSSEGDRPSNSFKTIGLDELEQLLRQKSFTRDEIDRLTELLHSRTVDSTKDDENKNRAPNTSEPAATFKVPCQENGASVPINKGGISTPPTHFSVSVTEEAASAAEIAKAYMGTMSSRVSPSTLGFWGQTFRQDVPFQNTVPYAPKSPTSSLAPMSGSRFSSVPRLAEEAYLTPKFHGGRSVIHNMARSPYSRPVPSFAYPEGSGDGYSGPSTSSQWSQAKGVLSGGKQVLKRRSSFLDDDFGSIGPIRRIRQRSNMMARQYSIMISPISSDVGPSSSSSSQKILQLDGPKDTTSNIKATENGVHRIATRSLASVPSQSSETARKILEQLDKMVPSPKEKSTLSKLALAMEKPAAKLTLNMLSGPARKTIEDIDSPKCPTVKNGVLDGHSGSTSLSPESSIACEKDKVGEKGAVEPADGGKAASISDGMGNTSIMVTDNFTSTKAVDSFNLGLAANSQNKQHFQMSAPEDFLEDDDNYSGKKKSTAQNDKQKPCQMEKKAVAAERTAEKLLLAFSEAKSPSHSTLRTGSVKRASVEPIVAGKGSSGFTFPFTPASDALSEPPTPTPLPSTTFGVPVQSKEQTVSPLFGFGSTSISKISTVPASPTTSSTIVTPIFKFGAASDSKAVTKRSDSLAVKVPSTLPASPLVTPVADPLTLPTMPQANPPVTLGAASLSYTGSHKTDQIYKTRDSIQPSQNASSSSSSLSIFSGFSSSKTLTLANGLMASTSSTVAVSAAPAAPFSGISTNPSSGSSRVYSSPSISAATAPTIPIAPVFQFGSASAVPPLADSVSPPSTTSAQEPSDLATKDKPSPFGTINSSFPAISSGQFGSTSSSIFGFSTPAISNTDDSSITARASISNQSQSSVSPFGSIAGSLFGSQTSTPGTAVSSFTQSAPSQFGSSSSSALFGLSGTSIFSSGSSPFGSSITGSKPFGLSSGFGSTSSVSFSTGSGTSPFSGSSNPFSSNSQSSFFASGFGSSSPATGFSFGGSSAAGSVSFGGSSTAGSVSFRGSSAAGFSFGSSLSAPSGPLYSFTSAASAATLGPLTPASFGSASPVNDQMIEDSMTEDTIQAPTPVVPSFGMAPGAPSPPNFVFGSPSVQAGGPSPFQFSAPQNPGAPQIPSSFAGVGSAEFSGGSFSLGSGTGDKSNRRIVKVKRDKGRRK